MDQNQNENKSQSFHFYRFPPLEKADGSGLLAISYDINADMVLSGYLQGIFPWPCEENSVLWFAPPERGILNFEDLHIPRSTAKLFKKSGFLFSVNQAFERVIRACADTVRKNQEGTWITEKIINAYLELHRKGFAVSFEVFDEATGALAGGLYGVRIDVFFAGESMFHFRSGASKFALCRTVDYLKSEGLTWMDVQVVNPLTARFGAKEIPRSLFMEQMRRRIRWDAE